MNGIDRAIAIFAAISHGAISNLARAVDRHPQELHKWINRGWVTPKHCETVAMAVLAAIPLARYYGLDPQIARPISLKELNPEMPDMTPAPYAAEEVV